MIRYGEEKDIGRLLYLLKQVNQLHAEARPDLFIGGGTKYEEAELKDLLKKEDCLILVHEEEAVDGYLFGFFQKTEQSSSRPEFITLYIDDLCVDKKKRGQGIGKALMEEAFAIGKRKGAYNVTLHAWEGNEKAILFYKKMGMNPQFVGFEKILGD